MTPNVTFMDFFRLYDERSLTKEQYFMKTMFVILAIGLTGMVNAQTEKSDKLTTEQKADKLTERMKKSLNLTDAQIPKVKEANLKMIQQKDQLKAEVNQRKQSIQENHKSELTTVLTPEQMKKATRMIAKKEKRMRKRQK